MRAFSYCLIVLYKLRSGCRIERVTKASDMRKADFLELHLYIWMYFASIRYTSPSKRSKKGIGIFRGLLYLAYILGIVIDQPSVRRITKAHERCASGMQLWFPLVVWRLCVLGL